MPKQVQGAQAAIAAAVVPRSDDQVVIACGRFSVDVVGFEWQGPRRLVFRAGTNGADLELLDILATERVGDRFTEIVLVSGDGIFAEAVSRLGLHADVTVASLTDSCSRRLRMAAKRVLDIDFDPNAIMEAA